MRLLWKILACSFLGGSISAWPDNLSPEFRAKISSSPTSFPIIRLDAPFGPGTFQTVRLNNPPMEYEGKYFSGFRFHSPVDRNALIWFFAYAPDLTGGSWYITPLQRQAPGFKNYHPVLDLRSLEVPYKPWPENYKGVFQQLPPDLFQSDTDYAIWFCTVKPTSFPVYFSIRAVPVASELELPAIQEILRLK